MEKRVAKKAEDSKYYFCVANGGFLGHIREHGSATALCGHKTKSIKGARFNRSRWKISDPLASAEELNQKDFQKCPKCHNIFVRSQEIKG